MDAEITSGLKRRTSNVEVSADHTETPRLHWQPGRWWEWTGSRSLEAATYLAETVGRELSDGLLGEARFTEKLPALRKSCPKKADAPFDCIRGCGMKNHQRLREHECRMAHCKPRPFASRIRFRASLVIRHSSFVISAVPSAFLLIDNSNSFTKFALSSRESLGPVRRAATRSLEEASIARVLRGWRFDAAILSSVVPEKGDLLARALAPTRVLRVTHKLRLGVGIDYPNPRSIGADRLANAASAARICGAPVIVVDFGTAVTFDIISRERKYVGGVIAPGLEAMTDYLHQRTALLPKISLREPPGPIGKTTKHAMLAGAIYGYRGLVREILARIRAEIGRAKVVATGGYADLIARGVREIAEVREHLTLDGLRIIGALNSGSGQL
jgi:type III pantothenate kinase